MRRLAAGGGGTGLLLGGLMIASCWWAAGGTLGLYLGPLALTPAAVAAVRGRMAWDAALAAGVVTAVAIGWVALGPAGAVNTAQAALLLAAWLTPLVALVWLGRRRGRGWAAVVPALVIAAAWLWLLWPIWLGPTLATAGVRPPVWLMTIHPLLAMNAAVAELGFWTEQPVAYRLTPLGQDIAPALPRTVLPAAAIHVALAATVTLGGALWRRSGKSAGSGRP